MTGILKDFNFAIAYLDDIIIFSKTPRNTFYTSQWSSKNSNSANLFMKKSKGSFFSKEIQYLGHILSARGIRPLPSKTHAIQHMQPPITPKQVRPFLGLVRYYRKFIKGFAKITKPLTLLTRQQVKFEWTPVHHTAFLHLSQEHDGTEFPIAFLLYTFTETQWKWSTTKQEAYGIYYAITK